MSKPEYKIPDDNPLMVSEPELAGDYTYGDYAKWNLKEMVELIRGRIFKMSPAPSASHQKVSLSLILEIGPFFKKNKCTLFEAPFDIILPIDGKKGDQATTVVQPDLCVICDPEIIKERGGFGVPDWIIEIVSPHTSKKDLQYKYDLYEEAGVKEYWTVLPKSQVLTIYFLEKGKYFERGRYVQSDVVRPILFPELLISLPEVFGPVPED